MPFSLRFSYGHIFCFSHSFFACRLPMPFLFTSFFFLFCLLLFLLVFRFHKRVFYIVAGSFLSPVYLSIDIIVTLYTKNCYKIINSLALIVSHCFYSHEIWLLLLFLFWPKTKFLYPQNSRTTMPPIADDGQ